ncbi:unnamed protein product [Amoebophrya sp. A120]|nr:unnamed protein product [Amoebophrya sp. A120]|eukprot:GSA120T00021199001.1
MKQTTPETSETTRGTERYLTVSFAAHGPARHWRSYQLDCVFKFDSAALGRGMTVEKLQIVSDPLNNALRLFGSIELLMPTDVEKPKRPSSIYL